MIRLKTAARLFLTFALLCPFFPSSGQNGKILSQTELSLEAMPVWNKIPANDTLKDRYKHLDRLSFHSFSYRSDSLEVNGIWMAPRLPGHYPVVIFNRGGNRDFDQLTVATMINYTSALAAQGYIVIGSNYRKKDEFGGADINDVLYLTETIKEIPMADTGRIGMLGWSRGGMMAYIALKNTNRIRTAVIGNGPTDLFSVAKERPEMEQLVFEQCIPGYLQHKEEALRERSVICWADKLSRQSSILILCGTKDDRVSHLQADALAECLKAINYDFELKKFDTDHYFSDQRELLDQIIIDWFDESLKSKKTNSAE